MIEIKKILHFDSSYSDLDLDSRPQGCENQKLLVSVISQSSQSSLDEIWYAVETCWFDEPCAHSFYPTQLILKGENLVYMI